MLDSRDFRFANQYKSALLFESPLVGYKTTFQRMPVSRAFECFLALVKFAPAQNPTYHCEVQEPVENEHDDKSPRFNHFSSRHSCFQ